MAQRGWITKRNRKKKGAVWVYHRYVVKPDVGKRMGHTWVVCSVAQVTRDGNRVSSHQLEIQATFYRREFLKLPRMSLKNMVGTRRLELLTSTVSR